MLCHPLQVVCLAVLLGIPLFPSWAFGQASSDDSDVQTLEQVVVSATKTEVPLRKTTSAVEVWTAEDLERRQIKTVVEALRLSQGMVVTQNGGPGGLATVRIRGGSSSQTLVLIDGAIVNNARGGIFDFSDLTVDNIAKIEIVRGAQSTVWGSDAMGGVISITTKRGYGRPKVGGFFEYGAFNTIREGGSLSGQKGQVDFSLVLSRWDTSNISAINYRRGASERDSYRNWQGSGRIGTALPADGRFDFTVRWSNGSVNIDNSFGPADVYKAKTDTRRFVFSGTWRQPLTSWWTHVLTLSRAQSTSVNHPGTLQRNTQTGVVGVPFGSPSEGRELTNRVESQHDFRLNRYVTLMVGYQFRDAQQTSSPAKINASHAGFGQIQFNLWDRVFATAGLRHDAFNTFGNATTYRVTGGYVFSTVFGEAKIRSSYATGFRAPNINELFFPDFGNPDLRPEKSRSFDVGVDQSFFDERVTIGAGYFWNRYRQLIQTIRSAAICGTGTYGPNFCPANAASAKSQGWELSADVVVMRDRPWTKRLELQWRYTVTLARDLDTTRRLIRRPADQATVSVLYQPVAPLTMTLDFRFVGSQFDDLNNTRGPDGFTVFGLAATYDISRQVQAYVRVDNLLDEEYEEVLNFGTPGRSVFGGLRVNFDMPFL